MRDILSSVAALLLSIGLLLLGTGLLGTLLGVRMAMENFPLTVSGLVMSAYFAGLAAGSLWCRGIIRRVGHIRAFSVFASLMSTAALAHAYVISALTWGVLRALTGFCMAGLYMVTESWLNARANNRTRGQILSLYMVTTFLALGAGQFLLALGNPRAFVLFGLSSILFSLGLVPVALTRAMAPVLERASQLGFRQLYALSPLGVIGALGAGLLSSGILGMGPIFGRDVGMSLTQVSQFMGVSILGGLVLQWPIGRLSDRFDRRTVIVGVCIVIAALAAIIAEATHGSELRLLVLGGLFGGFAFTVYALSVAHANDFAEPDDLVEVSGGLILAYGIGAAIGPVAAAGFMGSLGPSGLFVYLAIVAALLAAFAMYRMARREAIPVAEQGPYVPLLRTTAEASQLDPRGEPSNDADQGEDAGISATEPAAAQDTHAELGGDADR